MHANYTNVSMKFSFSLLKKMVPGLGSAKDFAEKFNACGFEVEDAHGDTIEIKLPANRFADASSHWGIAKETAAIWNVKIKSPLKTIINLPSRGGLSAKIEDTKLCGRYAVRAFEIKQNGASPKWMQDILRTCGLRPINLVVDVMNYVMLEVGQPLHAFDAEKLAGEKGKKIIVRRAKRGEKIQTIDEHNYELDKDVLVIADNERALAIAGIKGGKYSEVKHDTKHIVVEAAYFDSINIFKTSRRLKLLSDASVRFSHGLHPELVGIGLDRATMLLKELADASLIDTFDLYPKKIGSEIIDLSIAKLNAVLGTELSASNVVSYLSRLGLRAKPKSRDVLRIDVPPLRRDITSQEDLMEEVMRLHGVLNIKPKAPFNELQPTEYQDEIQLKDTARNVLTGLGLNEVYNSTFISERAASAWPSPKPANMSFIELENPIAEDKKYLRPSLLSGIIRNIEDNFRFFDEVRLFEIGKVFYDLKGKTKEEWRLTLAIAPKKGSAFLELKGVLGELLERVGLTDYTLRPAGDYVVVESDHHVLGSLRPITVDKKYTASVAELNFGELLEVVEGEKEYEPLPKYPDVTRDISLLVNRDVRVGELLEVINNVSTKYVEDVDLIDFYEDPNLSEEKKSLTFRIVFQAEDHTLTDAEAGDELQKIIEALRGKFEIEVR